MAIADKLQSLSGGTSWQKVAVAPASRTPIPEKPAAVLQGGSGINSPLIEVADLDHERTWYDAQTVVSSDGLITFELQNLATLPMRDAGGALVELRFVDVDLTP